MGSLESAKRIKKEMWMKRSSFLGLEEYTNGCNTGYEHGELVQLTIEITVENFRLYIYIYVSDLENFKSKPPDLTSFLEEERRLEKLLYSQNKPERHDDTTRVSASSGIDSVGQWWFIFICLI